MKPTQGKAELAIMETTAARFLSPWITRHLQQALPLTQLHESVYLFKPICSGFSDACTSVRAQKKSVNPASGAFKENREAASKLGRRVSNENKLEKKKKKKKYSKQRAQPERKSMAHTPQEQSRAGAAREGIEGPRKIHQTNMLEIGWPFRHGS